MIVPHTKENWRPARNNAKYNKKGEILGSVRFGSLLIGLQSSQKSPFCCFRRRVRDSHGEAWSGGWSDSREITAQKIKTATWSGKIEVLPSFIVLQGGNKPVLFLLLHIHERWRQVFNLESFFVLFYRAGQFITAVHSWLGKSPFLIHTV